MEIVYSQHNSHTHCQAAPANAQTQAWQRVCLPNRTTKTTDKPTDEKEHRSDNRRLAQWRVTWLIKHSTSHQLLWGIDSFELRNPPLRQAPKRYRSCYGDTANIKQTNIEE